MRKYSKVLLAGLVASMMVGCQGEEKKETPVPTKDVNVQTTLQPTQEPQNLVEHEYIKDNENNKAVNSNVAYKIKEKQHPEDGSVWTSKVEECDKDGKVLKAIYYAGENIESSYEEVTYNAKGDMLTGKHYANGKLHTTVVYEYDSYGDLVKETEIRDGKEEAKEYKYLYDGDYMVKKIKYKDGQIVQYTENEYDDNNRIIGYKVYDKDEFLELTVKYEYDEKGNKIKITEEDNLHFLEANMVYDANANVIEEKYYRDEKMFQWTQYTY
ncbi:MAG: hypothetical protein IJD02_02480, partial [Lachnospiraceae bacterium]|nr:hypothetical protein [Lachnospiraceae bacterium]